MSTPGYPAYGAPPPPPGRRRPSAWWFVAAAGLMVAGVAVGVTVLVLTVKGFTGTDATIDVDGRPHTVSVPTDGDRMLWVVEGVTEPSCEIVDLESGDRISMEDPDASYNRDFGSPGDQRGAWVFDPGSGRLEVTCSPPLATVVEIGPAPKFREFFGTIALGIFLPFFLGGVGFLMLIIVGVLFATGRPRKEA
jgi:hypothetical protein